MNNLYISDLDGTLLRSNGCLSDYSRDSINELVEQGIDFTVASARGIESIKDIIKGVKLKLPVIEVNGAYITEYESEKVLCVNDISYIHKYELNYIFNINELNPVVSTIESGIKRIRYSKVDNKGLEWLVEDRIKHNDKRLTHTDNPLQSINERVVCYTIIDKKETLSGIYALLRQNYSSILEINMMENIYSPQWYWLSISSKEATKGKAIKKLRQLSNLQESQIYCFGDESNDLSMLSYADRGIAMGNAIDIVKERADEVIGTNDQDSVVRYIEKNEADTKEIALSSV